ncbi:type III secretion system export apparatus subunit SctU [Bradyrhizobium liaoningense]|uniref:type III secretion system export apparatus subunit SctU n=1 Tax=Bradyrhizobium liaoningense TaxID=43992 RepID=UPI001BAA4AE2|nr:type III secretion system export apparatus subunit SctU [Bradyrhizobium liaoningense]MBR0988370.1 type III secretion system export apparatus subunit SctU [Bradyrhizobium liaoningense]
MSQSTGEKTEPPSPKKIRDARAKGQVAKSQEVVTTASLAAVFATIWFNWPNMMARLVGLLDQIAYLQSGSFSDTAAAAIAITSHETVAILLPILGAALIAGIFANYLQIGSIFALESLMPKLEKVSPASGLKRIFSMKQLVEVLKSLVKISCLSTLLYLVIKSAIGPYIVSLSCGLTCQTSITIAMLRDLLLYSALAFVVVAGFDFMYQKYSYTKGLMMSKEERKREYKESEGDPHIKGHRRRLAQELVMGDAGQKARRATAVVVNPTHVAIALHYDGDKLKLPVVTAKGLGGQAHVIRTEAESAGVPIFRNVTLARTLYARTDLEDIVPDELFDAVAEVLVWVQANRHLLYKGPLARGVIDMDAGDHRPKP